MAKRIIGSTPKADGYRMPAEFEPQDGVWMLWPERNDNWRSGAKPAQETFCQVARAIARFEKVTMCVSAGQYQNARARLPEEIRVVEVSSNDAWVRDCGPTFLVNGQGGLRAVDWTFNAWGGLYDGLYFPWDQDALVGSEGADLARVIATRPDSFVVGKVAPSRDGEGTVMTTEMCLLSEGRNPRALEGADRELPVRVPGVDKVIWIKDGHRPEETNAHRRRGLLRAPGRGGLHLDRRRGQPVLRGRARRLRDAVERHRREGAGAQGAQADHAEGAGLHDAGGSGRHRRGGGHHPAHHEDVCIASYMNFLIGNDFVLVPQYDDEYDEMALQQVQEMFPEREVVGVPTREVVYGGGNIHCITQQQQLACKVRSPNQKGFPMSYQKGPGQTVVIALGGNALGNTPQEQLELVKNTASHIVDMVGEGVNVVVSHATGRRSA